ncbi:MAG TPA: flagellar biosynthesis protein FlhA [bacterium]|nr:flagellar biosynthesis protein FlhA [bacterium]
MAETMMASRMSRLLRHGDIMFAICVIAIVGVMIVPLPTFLLDLLLSFNIAFSLVLLLTAIYVTAPLELSVFPSLMLVTTLFRLALNVASTRLILGQGYAGEVIGSFGSFVVKGNYIVGFVIFIIIVVIQYIVVVRGTERNAEVSARFTLDAMPGKQMSIDADLNAGLIDDREAIRRREEIMNEADFYGAMDGASKYVRGDAVAGIIINIVNVIGGLAIGVLQRGLPIGEAVRTYTRLTIGDGLVTQVPALIVSTSAGIVVSRAAAESNLGIDIGKQLLSGHKPLAIVGGTLGVMALVPGLPTLPFLVLGGLAGALSYSRFRKGKAVAVEAVKPREEQAKRQEALEELVKVDRLELVIGYGLISMVDPSEGGDFLERVKGLRRQVAVDLGLVVPAIRIRDDVKLKPYEYEIRLKGARVGRGEVYPGQFLAIGPKDLLAQIEGTDGVDPAFGLPAKWVQAGEKDKAEGLGLTVVEAAVALGTHLSETIRTYAGDILSRQDVRNMLDELKKDSPAVVDEAIPNAVSLGTTHRVMQNLLREQIVIKDIATIIETLADYGSHTKDIDVLTEYVRSALQRTISSICEDRDGVIFATTLDPALEQSIAASVQVTKSGITAVVAPDLAQRIIKAVDAAGKNMAANNHKPIIICSPNVRLALKRLIEGSLPRVMVISYAEISADCEVHSVGMVKINDQN